MKRVVVIGGGAAGLMAAYKAAENGARVTVVERNERVARKVMITGKGRCNVTNDTDIKGLIASVTGDGRFLYSAFNTFSVQDTKQFFESRGVALKTERGNRVFPQSDKSVDIVDAMFLAVKKAGAEIVQGRASKVKTINRTVMGVVLEDGREFPAESVIIATGGMSYPLTGSTGDGYEMAKELGHTITKLTGSLVPVVVKEGWCSELQGLSLKNIQVKVFKGDSNKPLFHDFGELMFTHYGLSGPVILSSTAFIEQPESGLYKIVIDMKPALDRQTLDERILRDFAKYSNRDYINSLVDLLPRKMVPVVVKLSGIKPSAKVNQITREQREKLVDVLKNLTLTVTRFRPIDEAIVTKGGVNLKEVDPKTMQSKLVSGLYFAGEILDVDAFTGGFNLQIAFSTGYTAGNSVEV